MICSEDQFVNNHLESLKTKFLARNYPEKIINEQFNRALAKNRPDLLRPKTYPHDFAPVQPTRWRK